MNKIIDFVVEYYGMYHSYEFNRDIAIHISNGDYIRDLINQYLLFQNIPDEYYVEAHFIEINKITDKMEMQTASNKFKVNKLANKGLSNINDSPFKI